jgi:pantoate--beta-alanine ligase
VQDAVADGQRDPAVLRTRGHAELQAAGIEPDYFELVSTETLAPVSRVDGAVLAVLAAHVGGTRLIDNQLIQPSLNHKREVATPLRAPTTA